LCHVDRRTEQSCYMWTDGQSRVVSCGQTDRAELCHVDRRTEQSCCMWTDGQSRVAACGQTDRAELLHVDRRTEQSCCMWTGGQTNSRVSQFFRRRLKPAHVFFVYICSFHIAKDGGHVRVCIAVQKMTRHSHLDMAGCNYARQRHECLGPVLVFDYR